MDKTEIELSNGVKLSVDSADIKKTYQYFIDNFIKLYYQKTNDWNVTLQTSIKEIERISSVLQISKNQVIQDFLAYLESRLADEFSQLKGVDKIDILFESIEDYVQNIQNLVSQENSPEEIRLKVSALVENLNLFELSELIIHFAKKSIN